MNIKQALENNFFDQKQLGAMLYPNNKQPGQHLYKKIRCKEGKRMSFKDYERVLAILQNIITESVK